MNTHFFFSAARRLLVPVALAGATMLGTLGFSSVASAQERAAVGARGGRSEVVMERRHGVRIDPYWNPGVYYGPAWGGGYGYRGGRPFGEYRGGGATFHGGGGGFHGGGAHGGGGFHGGGAHGGGGHGGGHR